MLTKVILFRVFKKIESNDGLSHEKAPDWVLKSS